jgi:plasmid segregation protein ParM
MSTSALPVHAIDVGYGQTKFTAGHTTNNGTSCEIRSMPSLVVSGTLVDFKPLSDMGADVTEIEMGGKSFIVGPDAVLSCGANASYFVSPDYVNSDEYAALVAAAIDRAKYAEIGTLVLGTPVSNYKSAGPELEKRFRGVLQFNAKSIPIHNVVTIPQPMGGLAWYAKSTGQARELQSETILTIDPGRHTFDWVASRGLAVMANRSGSEPAGSHHIVRAIAKKMGEDLGEELRSPLALDTIDRFYYDGKPVTRNNVAVQMSPYDGLRQEIVDQGIKAMLNTIGSIRDFNRVLLVGGAACYYKETLEQMLKLKVEMPAFPPGLANVHGFQIYGEFRAKAITRNV